MILDKFNTKFNPAPAQKRQLKAELNKYIRTAHPIQAKEASLDGFEPRHNDEPAEPQPAKRRLLKSDQMNSMDFMQEKFEIIPLTGRWKKLIGYPQSDSKIMFYGKPGNGKSTLALQFAGYTSRTLGSKTLYVTSEEPFSYTLQEKLKRLGVANPNLTITGEFPADVSQYKYIFIDSVNNCGMKPEDVRNLPPDHFYVYVFQTTKSGAFRGSQEYLHDVDAEIKVEAMRAVAGKNRFGGYEEIEVLPQRNESPAAKPKPKSKLDKGRALLAQTLAGLK